MNKVALISNSPSNKIFNLIFLFIAFIHWCASFFLEARFFKESTLNYPALIAAKLIVLIGFWQIIAYIVKRYQQEAEFRKFIHHSSVYFIFSMLFLLLIWPGNWGHDDLVVLVEGVQNIKVLVWQHYLTEVFYFCAIFIFPTPVSVVILQVVCLSLVVGYFVSTVSNVFNNSKLAYLAYIPFFFPPTLTQNYYPIRATLYGYILLFLMTRLLFFKWTKKKITFVDMLSLALPAALLGILRSEGIYFVIAVPILFIFTFWHITSRKQKSFFFILTCIFAVLLQLPQSITQSDREKKEYLLTAYVASLGEVLNAARDDERQDLVDQVDQYLDTDLLKEKVGIAAYWTGNLTKEQFYTDNSHQLIKTYLKLVVLYPKVFFEERWGIFISSYFPEASVYDIGGSVGISFYNAAFRDDPISRYQSKEVRTKTLQTLQLVNSHPILAMLFNNNMLPIGFLFCLSLMLLLRKKFISALIVSLPLPALFAVFLTAPTFFFMYYFPYYLAGHVLGLTALLLEFNKSLLPSNRLTR